MVAQSDHGSGKSRRASLDHSAYSKGRQAYRSRRYGASYYVVEESPMSLAKRHQHSGFDMKSDIAGVKIPDSKMARDLTQLIRDTESDLLFHHSTRVVRRAHR
jgi:hypothetical protein